MTVLWKNPTHVVMFYLLFATEIYSDCSEHYKQFPNQERATDIGRDHVFHSKSWLYSRSNQTDTDGWSTMNGKVWRKLQQSKRNNRIYYFKNWMSSVDSRNALLFTVKILSVNSNPSVSSKSILRLTVRSPFVWSTNTLLLQVQRTFA